MSRLDKLITRFQSRPSDFTWNELVRLLNGLGYRQETTGKTSGSRRSFCHSWARAITVHKPHPGNVVVRKSCLMILKILEEEELI